MLFYTARCTHTHRPQDAQIIMLYCTQIFFVTRIKHRVQLTCAVRRGVGVHRGTYVLEIDLPRVYRVRLDPIDFVVQSSTRLQKRFSPGKKINKNKRPTILIVLQLVRFYEHV